MSRDCPAPRATPSAASSLSPGPWSRLARVLRRWQGETAFHGLTPLSSALERIQHLDFRHLSNQALRAQADQLRHRVSHTVSTDDVETEAFALVAEAGRRTLGLDPHPCQVAAALAMARGRVAELPTGEGKTLAAVFTAFLLSLTGRGVHVLTFNDYLARRDATWMGPLYQALGVSVACVQEGQGHDEKRTAFAAEVTYATAKEAGFDFLRDGIALDVADRVHRPFHAAIVDEADSVLVDEARVPLVLAGLAEGSGPDLRRMVDLTRTMVKGTHFDTDAEHRNVFLTEVGARALEATLACGNLYDGANQVVLESAHCALHAHALLRRDVDYIVRDGRLQVVDEFTGRVMEKRHWPGGLQAALEAKEGLDHRTQGRVLGTITLHHFLRLYPHLSGMTATALPAAQELKQFYGVDVHVLPPHVPSQRVDLDDAIFTHQEAKRRAVMGAVRDAHARGRPVLVGTASVAESDDLARALQEVGVPCRVLNARNDQEEAQVILEAGALGAVTISTNMAGRGTDIRLGGSDERDRDAVMALGGLCVLGTNRHESVRVDNQLRGRAGRQGDPGATRFFIALDDDIFRRHGLTDAVFTRHRLCPSGGDVATPALRADVAHAQRVVEGQCFDIRHDLFHYASAVDDQRILVQARRDDVIRGAPESRTWQASSGEAHARAVDRLGRQRVEGLERRTHLLALDRAWADHLAWVNDTRETVHLVSLAGQTPLSEFRRWCAEAFSQRMEALDDELAGEAEKVLALPEGALVELEHAKGPSSTWTYLVNDHPFKAGFELLQGGMMGFSAVAAGMYGPFLLVWLAARRWLGGARSSGTPPPAQP